MVKLVVGVLSAPKLSTATAAPVVLLQIKAPLVVKEAGFQVTFENDIYAVTPLEVGTWDTVKTLPVAVYPVPTTSPTDV